MENENSRIEVGENVENRRRGGKPYCTVGIDPGQKGAAALLIDGRYEDLVDWSDGPTVISVLKYWDLMHGIDAAVLEKVHAMPKQGVSSTFKFGTNYGWWKGALDCLGVSWYEVTPRKWMGAMGLCGKKAVRGHILTSARRLFPSAPLTLQKHSDRADALVIALYAFQQKIT